MPIDPEDRYVPIPDTNLAVDLEAVIDAGWAERVCDPIVPYDGVVTAVITESDPKTDRYIALLFLRKYLKEHLDYTEVLIANWDGDDPADERGMHTDPLEHHPIPPPRPLLDPGPRTPRLRRIAELFQARDLDQARREVADALAAATDEDEAQDLRLWERVLAPSTARVGPPADPEDEAALAAWRQADHSEFSNHWVAWRGGAVLDSDLQLSTLEQRVVDLPKDGLRVFKVDPPEKPRREPALPLMEYDAGGGE